MKTQRPRRVLVRTTKPMRRGIGWTVGCVFVGVFAVLVVAICVATGEGSEETGTVATSQSATPNLGVLVAGEGAAETYAYCIICHSERLVAQQGLTRQGWEEVVELMVEEYGMIPIAGPVLHRMLDYLSIHYGPDRPNFPLQ